MCRQNDVAYVHVLHDPVVVPLRLSESEKTWFIQAEKHHQTLKTPRSDKNPKSLHRIGAFKRRLTSSVIFWAAQGFGHGSWKFIYLVVITVIHPQRVVSWKWAPQPCFWNPSSKTVSDWWLHSFRYMAPYTDLVWNTWSISSHLGKCASATVMVGIFMMVMIVMRKTKINQDIDLKIIKMITMKILNNKTLWKSCLWQPTLPRSFTCKQFKDENAQGPPINCLSKKTSSSSNFRKEFPMQIPWAEVPAPPNSSFFQTFQSRSYENSDDKVVIAACLKQPLIHCWLGGIRWGVNLCGYLPSTDQSVSYCLYRPTNICIGVYIYICL